MFKATFLAVSLVAAATAGFASNAVAGFMQIDPTGTGAVAGSMAIGPISSSGGNMLADGVIEDTGIGVAAATVYAHNAFSLTSSGIPGAELTFLVTMPVSSSLFINPDVGGSPTFGSSAAFMQTGTAMLELFYDPTADADQATGGGYGAGGGAVKIAEGTVTIAAGTDFEFVQLSAGPDFQMAANTPGVMSIRGNGLVLLAVDFDPLLTDRNYIVNDIDSLSIDMTSSNTLGLPFTTNPIVFASSEFNVGSTLGAPVSPSYGQDGNNDFTCGSLGTCDLQVQMNTTLDFQNTTASVPEPTALAFLILGITGLAAVRRRKQ